MLFSRFLGGLVSFLFTFFLKCFMNRRGRPCTVFSHCPFLIFGCALPTHKRFAIKLPLGQLAVAASAASAAAARPVAEAAMPCQINDLFSRNVARSSHADQQDFAAYPCFCSHLRSSCPGANRLPTFQPPKHLPGAWVRQCSSSLQRNITSFRYPRRQNSQSIPHAV